MENAVQLLDLCENLKSHLAKELGAAHSFLERMTEIEALFDKAQDAQNLLDLNQSVLHWANLMQALHIERIAMLEGSGLSMAQAIEQDPVIGELEEQHRELLVVARQRNDDNALVVKALIEQTRDNLQALHRAASQDGVYTAKGMSKNKSSRTFAAA